MYYNVMVDFIIKWYQFYMPCLPHIIIVCSAIVVLPFSHMLTCLPILFWDFKIWKANAFFKLWLALFSVKIIASCLLVYADSVLGLVCCLICFRCFNCKCWMWTSRFWTICCNSEFVVFDVCWSCLNIWIL